MGVILSVNAISNYSYVYSTTYDTTEQYKYFKGVISNAQIKELMLKYGIVQTGDSVTDLRALYNAMYADAKEEVIGNIASTAPQQSQQTPPPQQQSEAPWTTLMSQIGLTATGNFSQDYGLFQNRIMTMQASAQTPQERANIAQLQSQASIVFIQQTNTQTSTSSGAIAQQNTPTPSGADITALVNKMYFLSAKA